MQKKIDNKEIKLSTFVQSSIFRAIRNNTYIPHKWIVLFARSDWLTRRWLAKYYSPPSSWRERKRSPVSVSGEEIIWINASYSACVVYTKTIIHRNVGECVGNLRPLRWIIVNYTAKSRGSVRRVRAPKRVFTWHHGGHVGVPKQWNCGHIDVPG